MCAVSGLGDAMKYMICNETVTGRAYDATIYDEYVKKVAGQIPEAARAYATASWITDRTDSRCLGDAWFQSLVITESAQESCRAINISLTFLGAYHDGHMIFNYKNVKGYSANINLCAAGSAVIGANSEIQIEDFRSDKSHPVWHQNALIDEVLWLEESRLVSHEILLEYGRILIVAEDFMYEWRPNGAIVEKTSKAGIEDWFDELVDGTVNNE